MDKHQYLCYACLNWQFTYYLVVSFLTLGIVAWASVLEAFMPYSLCLGAVNLFCL